MTYSPIIPFNGYQGWSYLKRTMNKQTAAFNNQRQTQREEEYFRDKIGKVDTAEQLVNDPVLLKITLTAFGLEADYKNKFFIKKILESNTLQPDSLANRLSNKQYQKLAYTFGFGTYETPRSKISNFSDKILPQYEAKSFASAVGAQNLSLHLALNIESELPLIASSTSSENIKWYTILGSTPLRKVFETALNLPASFAAIDIDKQIETLQKRVDSLFGSNTLSQFSDAAVTEKLIKKFIINSSLAENFTGYTSSHIALNLLTNN